MHAGDEHGSDQQGSRRQSGGPAFVADATQRGTDPQLWLDWQRRFPPLDVAGHRRLVVVAPHPDDEVLGAGGLIAGFAASGREVVVLAVTNGEAASPPHADIDELQLGALRGAQSVEACRDLGVGAPRRLGIPDGDVAGHETALQRAVRDILEPGDLVLCTFRGDGHPDHEAVARAVVTAVAPADGERAVRLLQFPVWMWHWSRPDDPRVPWDRALQWTPGADAHARKARAMTRFRSQLEPTVDGDAVLSATTLQRCLQPREVYFAC